MYTRTSCLIIAVLSILFSFSPSHAQNSKASPDDKANQPAQLKKRIAELEARLSAQREHLMESALVFAVNSDPFLVVAGEYRFGTGVGTGDCRPFGFTPDSRYFVFSAVDSIHALDISTNSLSMTRLTDDGVHYTDGRSVSVVGFSRNHDDWVYIADYGSQKDSLIRSLSVPFQDSEGRRGTKQITPYSLDTSPFHDWLLAETTGHPYRVLDGDQELLEVKKYPRPGNHWTLGRFPQQGAAVSFAGKHFATIGDTGEDSEERKKTSPNGEQALRVWSSSTRKEIEFRGDKEKQEKRAADQYTACLLYTSPSPRDKRQSRMPSSA